MLAEGQPVEETPEAADEPVEIPEQDRVLSAPWSHRGTVEVAVVLRGGDRGGRDRPGAPVAGPRTGATDLWAGRAPGVDGAGRPIHGHDR